MPGFSALVGGIPKFRIAKCGLKLETSLYRDEQKVFQYPEPFSDVTERQDGRTDSLIKYDALRNVVRTKILRIET